MTTPDLKPLTENINRFLSKITRCAVTNVRSIFDKNGPIIDRCIKEWYGVATVSNGRFTFDCSSAGFQEILHVDPRAISDDDVFNNQVFASINHVSTTEVSGCLVTGAVGIFKSDGLTSRNIATVMIKITGT